MWGCNQIQYTTHGKIIQYNTTNNYRKIDTKNARFLELAHRFQDYATVKLREDAGNPGTDGEDASEKQWRGRPFSDILSFTEKKRKSPLKAAV